MNINGIETQCQNYAAAGSSTKSSSSESMFASFQKEILNWEKRIKEAIDKKQENDSNGSLQMSEKQWRNLMEKVDNAIDTLKDSKKEQEQEEKKKLDYSKAPQYGCISYPNEFSPKSSIDPKRQ